MVKENLLQTVLTQKLSKEPENLLRHLMRGVGKKLLPGTQIIYMFNSARMRYYIITTKTQLVLTNAFSKMTFRWLIFRLIRAR